MNTHEAVVWVCSLFCCSRDDYQLLHRGLLDIFMYYDQFAVGILSVLQVKRQKKARKKRYDRSITPLFLMHAQLIRISNKKYIHTSS